MRKKMLCVFVVLCLAAAGCLWWSHRNRQAAEALEQAERLDIRLMRASYSGTPQEVRDALQAGARVNAAHFGSGGFTPSAFAALNKDPQVITTLLAAGANPNIASSAGLSPLLLAAGHNPNVAVIAALLAGGADMEATDAHGDTPLLLAVRYNENPAVAELLLASGANGGREGRYEESAFEYAGRDRKYANSAIFAWRDPQRAIKRALLVAEERLAELKAGEDDGANAEPEEYEQEEYDETSYKNDPDLLPDAILDTPTLDENAGIDLDKYNVDNPANVLPGLDAPPTFEVFAPEEMPVLDGALASFPLYSAFAKACYTGLIPPTAATWKKSYSFPNQKIVCYSNTGVAFANFIRGDVDIFFGLEPDATQKAEAAEMGADELVYTSLGREAFVFFVHKDNPVDNLTTEQLRAVYAGKITNWKELGGQDEPILAFQRNQGSGSQSALLRFMAETPLMRPPQGFVPTMEGIVTSVAKYRPVPNALGFSFYFFSTRLVESENIKLLRINGVAPSTEHIRDRSYPLLETRYAISLKKNTKPAVAAFLAWMQGPQGQELVHKMGYVGNE